MEQGKIMEAEVSTVRVGATPTGLTAPPQPPRFFTGRMPFLPPNQQRDDAKKFCCRIRVADTLPTPQLKLVADLIAPFLTELFNRSLSTATVPTVFKTALITPLIKKPDLDFTDPIYRRCPSFLSVLFSGSSRATCPQQTFCHACSLHIGHITLLGRPR